MDRTEDRQDIANWKERKVGECAGELKHANASLNVLFSQGNTEESAVDSRKWRHPFIRTGLLFLSGLYYISVLLSSPSCLRSSVNKVSLYLYCPVVGQFRLFLQFLLQVAIGLCLFGPDCCGSEATVVPCGVTFIQDRALLGVHSHHDHTCGEPERRAREGETFKTSKSSVNRNEHREGETKTPTHSSLEASFQRFVCRPGRYQPTCDTIRLPWCHNQTYISILLLPLVLGEPGNDCPLHKTEEGGQWSFWTILN